MKPLWLGLLLLASPAFGAVDARDYDAFWLWSGVTPQPVLKQAKTLYILQGQINATRRAPLPRPKGFPKGAEEMGGRPEGTSDGASGKIPGWLRTKFRPNVTRQGNDCPDKVSFSLSPGWFREV